ncbi:TIGR02391 family protein [Streptomyces sp. NPDC088910]|uniref:TIGR02391 family protein n=1 Tax=Streptomyces sp. NPDC088910 TaxID=3365911 RepID=UPI0037FE2CF2
MDLEWMRQQLEAFDDLALRYERSETPGSYIGNEVLYAQLHRAEPTIKQILRVLDPALAEGIDVDQMAGSAMARSDVQRGLGILADRDEWAVRLTPDAPTLTADQFHTWVWDGARALWASGHYREAVTAAARKVNAETQNKVGRRDVSEAALFQSAFSMDPAKQGQPRLRLVPDDGSDTYRSVHRGAMSFAVGFFGAVRNPNSHEDGLPELSEQEALEQLGALSMIARWVDSATLTEA